MACRWLRPGLLALAFLPAGAAELVGVPAGGAVSRTFTGTPLTFDIELPPGDWLIEASEAHVDVRFVVNPGAGSAARSLNGPAGGHETVRWVDSAARDRRLSVRAETATVLNQRGEVTIRTSRIPLPTGRLLRDAAEAETAVAELAGSELFGERERALAAAQRAAGLWRELGERSLAAAAALAAGSIAFSVDDFDLAKSLADGARQDFAALEDDDGAGYALNLAGLIEVYRRNYEEADRLLAEAEHLLAGRYAENGVNPATSNRCFAALRRRRLDHAESCYERLQQLAADRGALSDESLYLNNLGGIHAMRGDAVRSIGYLERAEALARGLGDERSAARRASNIATQFRLLGDMQRALDNYQRALTYFRQTGDDLQKARVLNNVGLAYLSLGEANRSLPFLQEAYALRREGEDVAALALTMNNIGAAHIALGEPDVAKDWHARALAAARDAGDRDSIRQSLGGLGRAELALGNTARSVGLAREVAGLIDASGRKGPEGTALHQLGVALLADGQPVEALDVLARALSLRRETGFGAGQAETLTAIAAARMAVKDREIALETALGAIDLIESLRTDVVSPDLRAAFQASVAQAYDIAIELQMSLPGADARLAALTTAERYRARALVDVLARDAMAQQAQLPPQLVAERNRLRGEINLRSLQRIRGADDDGGIAGLLAELDVAEARIAAADPRFGALAPAAPPSAKDMQALLDGDTLVLQYFLGGRRSYGWMISRDSIESFELPEKAVLADRAREAYFELSRRSNDPVALRDLGDVVLAPAASTLADYRRIAIIADGALHYLPFDALDAQARHGLRDKTVVYLPSFTTLALLRATAPSQKAGSKAVAVLADPVFNARDPRLRASGDAAAGAPQRAAVADAPDPDSLNRLSMTAREAAAIAALLPADDVVLLSGFAATPEALRSPAVRDARSIHIATHGIVDSRFPAMSGLVLSMRSPDGEPLQGYVGLRDIYALRLAANLVVLSACETAIGREMRGEGLLGLTRGFMFAGARQVIASLWQVEDRATAELMRAFYTGMLRDGLEPADALARAKREIRAERRWRHPYYWSGFTLQGDWR